MLSAADITALGASAQAIAHHYDVGDDFFRLWLDPSMTYTAGLYDRPEDDLATAQAQKIDFLLREAGLTVGGRLLDIGCGWGGALRRAVATHGAGAAVGLTLSAQQRRYALDRRDQDGAGDQTAPIEVLLTHWADHAPEQRYDAIVSVEAIEAFVRPKLRRDEKVAVYRGLFERCRDWLVPGGGFALQMISYGSAPAGSLDSFIAQDIFPESDLPALSEVIEASEGLFSLERQHNDRAGYVRTLRSWLAALKQQRLASRALIGSETVTKFEAYLRMSWFMFENGHCDLHRLTFRRIDDARRPNSNRPVRRQETL
jgi:cyclopropane-fatty-acyl-phospholipid synthase